MKNFELKEIDSKSFSVKAILDGQKLDKYGYGKGDGTDRVRLWKKVTYDDSALRLEVSDFVPEETLGAWIDEASDKVPLNTCTVVMEKSPPRIVFAFNDKDGKRVADGPMKDSMYVWSDNIVGGAQNFKNAKVKVTGDAPSMSEPGTKSMVTSPMDEHVTYDRFWDAHLKFCQSFVKNVPASGRPCGTPFLRLCAPCSDSRSPVRERRG